MNISVLALCLAQLSDAGVEIAPPAEGPPVAAPAPVDAGSAAVDAGAPAPPPPTAPPASPAEPAQAFAARVHEMDSPLAFRVALGAKDARTRAREAGAAIESALDAEVTDAALVAIEVRDERAVVRVNGRAVATLTQEDARAEGALELGPFCDELETRLDAFVAAEHRRKGAQQIALHVFLSVAIALLALLTVRALLTMFSRLERTLEERRDAPTPLKLFGVVLLSAEALRGVSLILLYVGRVFSIVAVLVAALLFALSQFNLTRPLVGRIAGWALSPIVSGADALARALPGVVLAAALVVVAATAVRLARLLLDDIGAGRVESRLSRARVRPMRALAPAAIVLLSAPLIVGAAFLRFGTPLETLVLLAGGAVALACVPLLASAVVGGAVLWRSRVRVGDWVTIGRSEGEVSSIDLVDVTLVPSSGGTVVVPMVMLAFVPVQRHASAPSVELAVVVKRDRPLADIEAVLLRVARTVDSAASVAWASIQAETAQAVLRAPPLRAEARSLLVRALADATERSEITLLER